jgi:hypothetical protein
MPEPTRQNETGHGTPEKLREFAAEMLHLAQVHADLAVTFALVGDDTGLQYATRNVISYVKAAATTVADLSADKLRRSGS